MSSDNYYGVDEEACWFFMNRGEERLKAAAEPPFEALKQDRQAVEGLMGSEKPETEEGLFQAYAQAAAKLGFETSVDEIKTVYEEIMGSVTAKTQESEEDVKELSTEELDAVAGGGFWFFNDKDHPNCKDTYKD